MSFQRGQVVTVAKTSRGASKPRGIVLVASPLGAVVCMFHADRRAWVSNFGTGALRVVGRTKKIPAKCTEALIASVKPQRKPRKRR